MLKGFIVITVLWVSVEQRLAGTLSVGFDSYEAHSSPRDPEEHLKAGGTKVDEEGCWLVHSREARGGWREDGLRLLARWITALKALGESTWQF